MRTKPDNTFFLRKDRVACPASGAGRKKIYELERVKLFCITDSDIGSMLRCGVGPGSPSGFPNTQSGTNFVNVCLYKSGGWAVVLVDQSRSVFIAGVNLPFYS